MNRRIALGVLLVWILFPIWSGLAANSLLNRWIIQESPRLYYWMTAVGIVWGLPLLVVGNRLWGEQLVNRKWRTIAGLSGLSMLAGVAGGPLLLGIINCAFDDSGGERVTVERVALFRTSVRYRVTSGEHSGLTFCCGNAAWYKAATGNVILRRGRLGIYWCQLQ